MSTIATRISTPTGLVFISLEADRTVYTRDFQLTRGELPLGAAGELITSARLVTEHYSAFSEWAHDVALGEEIPAAVYASARDFFEAIEMVAAHLGLTLATRGGWLHGAYTPTFRARVEVA